jgi:hypothetical protein
MVAIWSTSMEEYQWDMDGKGGGWYFKVRWEDILTFFDNCSCGGVWM